MTWGTLRKALLTDGEVLTPAELDAYISALLGSNASIGDNVVLNPALLAGEILGFENAELS